MTLFTRLYLHVSRPSYIVIPEILSDPRSFLIPETLTTVFQSIPPPHHLPPEHPGLTFRRTPSTGTLNSVFE